MTALDPAQRAACAALSAWLGAQRVVFAWSLVWTGAALVAMLVLPQPSPTRIGLAASLLSGGVASYLALRLHLDARLFRDLADHITPTLADLDASLAAIGLRAAATVPRALEQRMAGTLRLVRLHMGCVLLQTALAAITAAARHAA